MRRATDVGCKNLVRCLSVLLNYFGRNLPPQATIIGPVGEGGASFKMGRRTSQRKRHNPHCLQAGQGVSLPAALEGEKIIHVKDIAPQYILYLFGKGCFSSGASSPYGNKKGRIARIAPPMIYDSIVASDRLFPNRYNASSFSADPFSFPWAVNIPMS